MRHLPLWSFSEEWVTEEPLHFPRKIVTVRKVQRIEFFFKGNTPKLAFTDKDGVRCEYTIEPKPQQVWHIRRAKNKKK